MTPELKFLKDPYGKFTGNEYKYLLECLDSENKKKTLLVY